MPAARSNPSRNAYQIKEAENLEKFRDEHFSHFGESRPQTQESRPQTPEISSREDSKEKQRLQTGALALQIKEFQNSEKFQQEQFVLFGESRQQIEVETERTGPNVTDKNPRRKNSATASPLTLDHIQENFKEEELLDI